jgi:hypothetical protein
MNVESTHFVKVESTASVRMLAIATGVICGVLIAASTQILLRRMHVELGAVGGDAAATAVVQTKSALAWWLIAGAALAGGFIAAAITRFLMLNWWPLRWLRWIGGALVVAALGVVGHLASAPTGLTASAYAVANFSGMIVALIGALIGAFFAARH